jgi:hypothetical protein
VVSGILRAVGELETGRPEGYRSRRTLRREAFMDVKGVRGSAKRRMVCLPCLKRTVHAVAWISSSLA